MWTCKVGLFFVHSENVGAKKIFNIFTTHFYFLFYLSSYFFWPLLWLTRTHLPDLAFPLFWSHEQ